VKRLGKVPEEELLRYVIKRTGIRDNSVVVPPKLGIDFSALKITKDLYLISATDPVTGAGEDAGWYGVNVSANDVATSGNKPRYMSVAILLPEFSNTKLLDKITMQIHKAARKLEITIVGGHTEYTPNLKSPIVVCTCFTTANKFVSASNCKENDAIVQVKSAGLEGTSIIAKELRERCGLGKGEIERAKRMNRKISIVKEALFAFNTGFVNAIHDPTEGGLLGGLYEMAKASNMGFYVYEEEVMFEKETLKICSKLNLDPLKLISSGSLLISLPKQRVNEFLSLAKESKIKASCIGIFKRGKRILIRKDGKREEVKEAPMDELWRLFIKKVFNNKR
jgi:hydrogenase maturation factor